MEMTVSSGPQKKGLKIESLHEGTASIKLKANDLDDVKWLKRLSDLINLYPLSQIFMFGFGDARRPSGYVSQENRVSVNRFVLLFPDRYRITIDDVEHYFGIFASAAYEIIRAGISDGLLKERVELVYQNQLITTVDKLEDAQLVYQTSTEGATSIRDMEQKAIFEIKR